jgi:hypothetical protein
MKKYVLVRFNYIFGEHESNVHTVLEVKNNDPERTIKERFGNFYDEETYNKTNNGKYLYCNGEFGFNVNGWEVLTPSEYKVLKRLGLAY